LGIPLTITIAGAFWMLFSFANAKWQKAILQMVRLYCSAWQPLFGWIVVRHITFTLVGEDALICPPH